MENKTENHLTIDIDLQSIDDMDFMEESRIEMNEQEDAFATPKHCYNPVKSVFEKMLFYLDKKKDKKQN